MVSHCLLFTTINGVPSITLVSHSIHIHPHLPESPMVLMDPIAGPRALLRWMWWKSASSEGSPVVFTPSPTGYSSSHFVFPYSQFSPKYETDWKKYAKEGTTRNCHSVAACLTASSVLSITIGLGSHLPYMRTRLQEVRGKTIGKRRQLFGWHACLIWGFHSWFCSEYDTFQVKYTPLVMFTGIGQRSPFTIMWTGLADVADGRHLLSIGSSAWVCHVFLLFHTSKVGDSIQKSMIVPGRRKYFRKVGKCSWYDV